VALAIGAASAIGASAVLLAQRRRRSGSDAAKGLEGGDGTSIEARESAEDVETQRAELGVA
jgi:hypothetical protein